MTSIIEVFDISLTIINSVILVFAAIIVQSNPILLVINLISVGAICGLSLYIFSQRNPYYIIPSYVLAVFGFIFTIGLIVIPELPFYSFLSILFVVVLILDAYLIYGMVSGTQSSSSKLAYMGGQSKIIEEGKASPTPIKDRYVNSGIPSDNFKDEKELLREKNKTKLIGLVTVIGSVFLIFTAILFFF